MTTYEYGIDWIRPERRESEPHRTGMTLEEAQKWLVDPGFDWTDVFMIVRRPIGAWENVEDPKKEAKYDFLFNTWPADGETYTCPGGVLPTPPGLDTHVIGKNCDQYIKVGTSFCVYGCGRSALRTGGGCAESGCYGVPG